jgi:hypothetical protein
MLDKTTLFLQSGQGQTFSGCHRLIWAKIFDDNPYFSACRLFELKVYKPALINRFYTCEGVHFKFPVLDYRNSHDAVAMG